MHHKHKCQFSPSRRTVATVNASYVGTVKTGLQHSEHISPMGFLRTHKPNTAYVHHVGDRLTQKTKPRRGDAGSGNVWGAGFMTTGDRGPWPTIRCPPPYLHSDKWGRKHTQNSTVPSSPSLTSSFSLLPSYCVGGSANRKVRVSETGGRANRAARESTFNPLANTVLSATPHSVSPVCILPTPQFKWVVWHCHVDRQTINTKFTGKPLAKCKDWNNSKTVNLSSSSLAD